MEAVRLIEITRCALAHSPTASDVLPEAWQAQALAEVIGSRLAVSGPPVVRAEALGLCESARRACRTPHHHGHPGDIRALRLTGIREPRCALYDLGALLRESAAALFGAAVAAEGETFYWQCVEAIDAAEESGDRVEGILRGLALPERGGVA